ncbi:hypothetical protein IAU59_006800 [Kwoniella sp. CBS 9459]
MSFAQLASTLGLQYNYSLWSIPAVWVVGQVPLWWAIYAANTTSKGAYNNANPKDSWERLKTNKDIPPQLRGQITRAIAADNNTHTNLPLFAAALGTAHAARVDTSSLHFYALMFLGSRIAYSFAYVLIEKRKYSPLRSFLYSVGVYATMALFVKASWQFNKLL